MIINDKKVLQYHIIYNIIGFLTVTKIKQERANQDRTKIGSFFDFLLYFSIFLLEIVNIAILLSCEAMLKISSKNIKKCRRKSKKGPILVLSWLVLSCLIFVTVTPEHKCIKVYAFLTTWVQGYNSVAPLVNNYIIFLSNLTIVSDGLISLNR